MMRDITFYDSCVCVNIFKHIKQIKTARVASAQVQVSSQLEARSSEPAPQEVEPNQSACRRSQSLRDYVNELLTSRDGGECFRSCAYGQI